VELETVLGGDIETGAVLPNGWKVTGDGLRHELDVGLLPTSAKRDRGHGWLRGGSTIVGLEAPEDLEIERGCFAERKTAVHVQQHQSDQIGTAGRAPTVDPGLKGEHHFVDHLA
jgi:hypothetical protein